MLDPWKLTMLVKLEVLGTMNQVAQSMQLATSTVSQQLSALEQAIGLPILERSGRNVQLTPLGKQIAHESAPIIDALDGVADLVTGERDAPTGLIRLSAFSSALSAIVIPALAVLHTTHPQLRVEIYEEEPDVSLPLLKSGQRDAVISASFGRPHQLSPAQLRHTDIASDSLVAVVSTDHKLAQQSTTTLAALAGENWMLEPPHTYLRNFIQLSCEKQGFQPLIVATLSSQAAMLEAVSGGLGVTVLPQFAIENVSNTAGISFVKLIGLPKRNISGVTTARNLKRAGVQVLFTQLQTLGASPKQ